MKKRIKIPFVLQKGAVTILCTLCVLFFTTSGCGKQDSSSVEDGKRIITPDGSEIWVGGNGCDCKEELYEYNVRTDKKHPYHDQFINNWLFVGFHPQVQDTEIVAFLDQTGFFKPLNRRIDRYGEEIAEYVPVEKNYATILVNTKEQKTCTQLKELIREMQESSLVAYANLVFWWDEQGMGSFTSYFYVDVGYNNGVRKDLSDLYEVTQETNTTVISPFGGYEGSVYHWVRVNNNSNGNAMQMANYFGETGKFGGAYLDWILENPYKPVLSNH